MSTFSLRAQLLPAITTDPAPDAANPPTMETMQIPSHGAMMNALVYVAAGAGPHPAVVLLHGFPGNEKNLDLAQAMRRAGWDVLYFNYRGSWGTPGAFSFGHAMEDTQAAISYLRDPAVAKKLRLDPANIVVAGHSMGGLMATYAAAQDPTIRGAVLISAADMAGRATPPPSANPEVMQKVVTAVAANLAAEGLAPLAGCTPESLAQELISHSHEWALAGFAPKLTTRPALIVTSDDGGAASAVLLAEGIRHAGGTQVSSVHIATDHGYSGKRIELETTVLHWLSLMEKPEATTKAP